MWKSFMAAVLLTSSAAAHELTPTYPEFKPHIVDGVYYAKLHMWNRREDVIYYEISVHDVEWNKIPFHSNKKIMHKLLNNGPTPQSELPFPHPPSLGGWLTGGGGRGDLHAQCIRIH